MIIEEKSKKKGWNEWIFDNDEEKYGKLFEKGQ